MTFLTRIALVLTVALALQACSMYKQAQGPLNATAELKSGAAISVESRNGSVEIIADSSLTEVQIDATVRCTGDTQEEANARLAKASLDVGYDTAGTLTIKPVFPQGPRNNDGASIIVRLPVAEGATIKTSNGSVKVSKLGGKLSIQTSNARVSISDHNGPATVNTSNGAVEVIRLAGSLTVDTSNGKVDASDVGGPVTIDTSNGSIRLALRPDQNGPLKLDTSNNSIVVTVGPTFAGHVKFDTSNGRVNIKDNSKRVRTQQLGKSEGTITVGEGGTQSVLDTSNGRIDFEITS